MNVENESEAFRSSLAAVLGQEAPPAEQAEEVIEKEQEKVDEPAESPEPEKEEGEKSEPEKEVQLIAGFTEEELRNLLSRAAEVDELKSSLRKAHGKIGELNGKLTEVKAPAKEPEPKPKHQVEEDYPDIAQYVQEQMSSAKPAPETAAVQEQPQESGIDPVQIELAVMDHLHEGWREKVASRDFNLWLAGSGDEMVNRYQSALKASELAKIINEFDATQTARGQRSQEVNKRLEQAITPQGNAGKQKLAPPADEAFQQGLRSVLDKYRR